MKRLLSAVLIVVLTTGCYDFDWPTDPEPAMKCRQSAGGTVTMCQPRR